MADFRDVKLGFLNRGHPPNATTRHIKMSSSQGVGVIAINLIVIFMLELLTKTTLYHQTSSNNSDHCEEQ